MILSQLDHISQLISMIRKYGGDVNCQDDDGQTPLHFAVKNDLGEMVRFLLKNGADKYAEDCLGANAMDYAIIFDHEKIIELLK